MAKANLPKKSATQKAFQRLAWALQTILTLGNQTEVNFALQVTEMFAALELDPKTGHYSNDSQGVDL
jgi:hypothetical protein